MRRLIPVLALPARPARAADPAAEDYVAANLLAILYHELGHALIDVMRLPIFGQEEDAADVLSVMMIHEFFEEESAVDIAYAAAQAFLDEAEARARFDEDVAWWDVHAPDLQRYYTFVCLFYGANPEERAGLALELGLPKARAYTCEEEFRLANESWGPVLDDLYDAGAGTTLRYGQEKLRGAWAQLTAEVIEEEVAALNADLSLPVTVSVLVERCGTVNAFYDPGLRVVTICTEFAEYLAEGPF